MSAGDAQQMPWDSEPGGEPPGPARATRTSVAASSAPTTVPPDGETGNGSATDTATDTDTAWPSTPAPTSAPPGPEVTSATWGPQHAEASEWPDEPDDEPTPRDRALRLAVDIVVVAACSLFVFLQLGPSNIFSGTTPAGGDMGAHVWGPAYLRDHLLPHGQLAGWAPDWYAGFPAYQFYMVVPSLAIVLLDWGVSGPWIVLPLAAVALALRTAVLAWSTDTRKRNLALAAIPLALLFISLPYGAAFKIVSISGAVTLPISAYAFGRLANLRFPTPAVLAVGTLPFLFYRGFTIYGGNLASTLAGEFAFSISLSIGLLYLGVVCRGLDTGKHRALAAGLLALTGLCHLIPAFWVLAATGVIVAVRFRRSSAPVNVWGGLMGAGVAIAGFGHFAFASGTFLHLATLALGMLLVLAGAWLGSESVRWLSPVLVVGGLLSSFWVIPFALRHTYVNDMGWEKLPYFGQEGESWGKYLFPKATPDVDLRWVFGLAMVGVGLSLALRFRVGIFLAVVTVATGLAFWLVPEGRLWNGRLLPFYYLTLMLLAALAVSEAVRLIAELSNPRQRAGTPSGVATALGSLAVVLLIVGMPLGVIPFDERAEATAEGGSAGYAWPSFSPVQLHASPESFVKGWANWNYSGYESKDNYREYYDVVQTMGRLGDDSGCGRAFWEYEKELDRYGTPMALMLLPYWTDGCIGSMEGLYFEASTTTPFHFLMQTELSTAPSAAQRDMPYSGFDITKGVQHLQMLGVKYYMATSDQAVQAADTNPDLTRVAESGPWVVYEVAEAELVTPLTNQPLVLEGVEPTQAGWLEGTKDSSGRFNGPSIQWFQNPARWGQLWSLGGPDDWERVEWSDLEAEIAAGETPETDAQPVTPVEVSNIDAGTESISFDVDEIGSPVLVKTSYFPNWDAQGAEGPWRVAPNLMVVVPTDTHVELKYRSTPLDWMAYALTLGGLIGLFFLYRRGAFRFSSSGGGSPDGSPDRSTIAGGTVDGDRDSDGDSDGGGGGERVVASDERPPSLSAS
jgi:hypothetical protein